MGESDGVNNDTNLSNSHPMNRPELIAALTITQRAAAFDFLEGWIKIRPADEIALDAAIEHALTTYSSRK